jgi:hypothetical protein
LFEGAPLKHFLNQELLAPNVLTVPVDTAIVAEFEDLARSEDPGPDYRIVKPWSFSDMRWTTAATETAFRTYEHAYQRLDIARHVRAYLDIERDVAFYTGFLHTRSEPKETNFHVDWQLTNNEAFTLLTPVCGFENGQTLLYKKLNGDVAEYVYKPGEAIIFGDHFQHSSPPGKSDTPFTLLAFNFGTDKMEHWNKILRTQGRQCPLVQRPDGKFMTIDPWTGPVGMGEGMAEGIAGK